MSYCKYYKEKEQFSFDGGMNWFDTGNVRKGNVAEYSSSDCGDRPEIYRMVTMPISEGYMCDMCGEFDGKYKFTLDDGGVVSAACSGISEISSADTSSSVKSKAVSVEIGGCVTRISADTFYTYPNLRTAVIHYGIDEISVQAFAGCYKLTSVTIPDSVTIIDRYAFYGCSGLTSVTLPDSVTNINHWAFGRCKSLNNIVLSNNTKTIGYGAFSGCTSLTNITIPYGVTSILDYAFSECSWLTSIEIPDSVTSIGFSFYQCTGLTSIRIGDGCTEFGGCAGCKNLQNFTILATTPPYIGYTEPFDDTNNCPIYVPASSVNAYKTAIKWRDYADRIRAI